MKPVASAIISAPAGAAERTLSGFVTVRNNMTGGMTRQATTIKSPHTLSHDQRPR